MNAEKKEKYDLDPVESGNPYQAPNNPADSEQGPAGETIKLTETKANWLIPSLAIGYVPLVFLLCISSNDPYGIFVGSGFFLMYAIPVYAIILIWNTVKRFRNGTNNVAVTLYQLVSLIILIWWLMTVMNFNGSPA